MAERRMFSKTVVGSDAFLDLPMSARLLYYELAMRADDDGFVSGPKKIMRIVGASPADLDALTESRFLISFDNGTVVIRHWKKHNYIKNDRYHATVYLREKALLKTGENGAYELLKAPVETACIHSGSGLDTEFRSEIEIEKESEPEQDPEKESELQCSLSTSSASSAPAGADLSALRSPNSALSSISLPTNEKQKQYVVGDEKMNEYRSLWPELDIRSEFLAMKSWLLANPDRRKSPAETPRFVNGWLARAREKARAAPAARPDPYAGTRNTAGSRRTAEESPPSYDIEKAMAEMMTTIPKVKKRERR